MIRRSLLLVPLFVAVLAMATPSTASAASGYNGAAAAAYADTYWQNYNSAWPSFANSGGDCTNFVSQALYAGGLAMRSAPTYSGNAAWYMVKNSKHRWSYAVPWVNAQSNSIFALQHVPGVTQVASYYGAAPGQIVADNAAQGDIVLYDFNNDGVYDHEAIVTARDSTGQWDLVDAHTNNRYHAYWTLAQFNGSWATTRIAVLHIPPTTS